MDGFQTPPNKHTKITTPNAPRKKKYLIEIVIPPWPISDNSNNLLNKRKYEDNNLIIPSKKKN